MEVLKRHLSYNLWANRRAADYVLAASASDFDTEVKSSMTSLRKTIYHIWDAEYIWMNRIQGKSIANWPSKSFSGNREETVMGWLLNSQAFLSLISESDGDLKIAKVEYQNLNGDTFHNNVEEIVMHVVNHSSFHRGQVVSILRGLGYTEFTSTDFITYLRTLP